MYSLVPKYVHMCSFINDAIYIRFLLFASVSVAASMDEQYMSEFDYYNYGREYDMISKGSGGHAKHKGKKENIKYAPSGNVRKIVANVQNAEKKEKQARQRINSC